MRLDALRAVARNRLRQKERKLLRWVEQQHQGYCARNRRQLTVEQKRLCDELGRGVSEFRWPQRDDLSWEMHFAALCEWGGENDGIPELAYDEDNCGARGLSYRTSRHGWVELGHFVHWACDALRNNYGRLRQKTHIHGHVIFPRILRKSQKDSMKGWLEARGRVIQPMQPDSQRRSDEATVAEETDDTTSPVCMEDERARSEVEAEIDVADAARDCYEKWRNEAAQQDAQAYLDALGDETPGTRGGQKRKHSCA